MAKAVELSRLRHVPAVFPDEGSADDDVDRIVGDTVAMSEVYKCIGRVAPLDVPVLIQGESGTGKELVARAIYQHSLRSEGPFLAINCAAIPEGLSKANCSATRRGRLPEPIGDASASSSRPTRGRCSSTKLAT